MALNKVEKKLGFSLVEVMITLAILSVGFAAVSNLMASSIKNSNDARSQIIASQLAQEGVELIRNLKDNNQTTFGSNSSKRCGGKLDDNQNYMLDKNSVTAMADCSSVNFSKNGYNTPLYVDDGSGIYASCPSRAGFYTYDTNCGSASRTMSKYYRKIMIYNNNAAKQVEVTSYVTWNGSGFAANIPNGWCTIGNKGIS